MRAARLIVLLVILALPAEHANGQDVRVDLEIVLAVDASASVDHSELRLQLGGIAAALRDPEIINAIRSGPHGRIALAAVLWADGSRPTQNTVWSVISNPAEAARVADMFDNLVRKVVGGTGIGMGVAASIRMLERNGFEGLRRVVDVSGDGIETPAREEFVLLMPQARAMAHQRRVTINGLAILSDVPDLDEWYRANVIQGPGSFVMKAEDFEDFPRAIKRKLLREVSPRLAGREPHAPHQKVASRSRTNLSRR